MRQRTAWWVGRLTALLVLASGAPVLPAHAAEATALTASASAGTVTHGAAVTVTGRLHRADGSAVGAEPVDLLIRRRGGTAWTVLARATTASDGTVRHRHTPAWHADYLLSHPATPTAGASRSAVLPVLVRPRLTAVPSAWSVREGGTVSLTGRLSPSHAGSSVTLQAYRSGRWESLARATLNRYSDYRFDVRRTAKGRYPFRVVKPADADHLTAVSPTVALVWYRLHTYTVTTKGRIVVSVDAFRSAVAATYADRRGWSAAHRRFQRVSSGGQLTVVLAAANQMTSYSSVCSSYYSCRVGRYVIVNQDRWRYGVRHWTASLADYRSMVVNHETGHWLGLGHSSCPARGALAPVMQQQSKSLEGCAANPWPLAGELRRV